MADATRGAIARPGMPSEDVLRFVTEEIGATAPGGEVRMHGPCGAVSDKGPWSSSSAGQDPSQRSPSCARVGTMPGFTSAQSLSEEAGEAVPNTALGQAYPSQFVGERDLIAKDGR